MLCWQAVSGGLPHVGYSERIKPDTARQLTEGWPLAGRIGELSAFARKGQVLCVLLEGKSALVQFGTRNRREFQALVSELGIPIHEA
jgi:hypothetical protein